MSMQDLSGASNSPVMTQLYQADALLPLEQADPNALGLVATLDGGKSMLLIQPTTPLSPEALAAAAVDYSAMVPEFEHVENDQILSLESPVFTWRLQGAAPELPPVELSSEVDSPVKVAVIDSGMDETHEIFAGTTVQTGWNTVDDDESMYDDVGHGTHIAGIIATYAPGVEIVPYKIVGAKGGKLSNVLEAYSKALEDDVDLINSSFGVPSPSYALEALVSKAYAQGVLVVAAAGNNGADTGFYPGHYAQTIAVASTDMTGHQLPSSNYGVWVDVAAYGYHVRSALPHNKYGYKSGTSQATAIVSAAVARLLMENSDLTFQEVLDALELGAEQVPDGTLAGTPIVQ
jgi:subtilisin family serine protease